MGYATYRWIVSGPFGARVSMVVTVTEQRVNRLLRYQTRRPGPLRAGWQLEFAAAGDAGATRVREQLTIPLGTVGRLVLALAGKFPDREVRENLAKLKQVLESGLDEAVPSTAEPPTSDRKATPGAGERETR